MMMECPRCGFAQPKDQYCASCGVNVDQLLARPKPFFVRLLANPNFHLSLIGGLILIVVGWIFYTQSAVVSREVRRVLDLPVSSRHAGDPNDPEAEHAAASKALAQAAADSADSDAADSASAWRPTVSAGAAGVGETRTPEEILAAAVGAPPPPGAKGAGGDPQKLELSYWEVPREALLGLLPSAQRLADGNGGRAYFWPQGAKAAETLQTTGLALGTVKSAALTVGAQISQETPATAPEMFQFSIAAQLTKYENKEATVRWAVSFALPQAEPVGESGPAMRQVLEGNLAGNATLAPQGLLMLVMEVPNRNPRDEYVNKAGEGPWSVFASPEFRSGMTDWVMVLQLK